MDTKRKPDCEQDVPQDIQNKFKIRSLENRVKNLETSVRTLEVVTGKLALANGIKVERYDGLIVISQIS